MNLNFAYGSNLWLVQMKHRCPGFEVLGKAVLQDYRWIINSRGYANVVSSKGDFVEGILYRLTAEDEQRLDRKEGVAMGSYKKERRQVHFNGNCTEAIIYIDPITDLGEPRTEYIRRINSGIHDAQLSEAYVRKYVRNFIPPMKTLQESDQVVIEAAALRGLGNFDATISLLRDSLATIHDDALVPALREYLFAAEEKGDAVLASEVARQIHRHDPGMPSIQKYL